MKITYSAHQIKITDDIHEFILKRADKIEARFGEMQALNVVLKAEKHQFEVELIVTAPRVSFYAKNSAHEVFAALDGAADKVIRQIRRYKERLKDRRHHAPHREVVAQLNPGATDPQPEGDTSDAPTIVAVPDRFASKPMSVAEAVTELQVSDETFLLFFNSETQEINLLYQADDSKYGWVEPLFT